MTTFSRLALAGTLTLALAIGVTLSAQQPSNEVANATFEVTSVKPNKTGDQNSRVGMSPNGRFQATNVTLKQIITNAYNVRSFQVVGGPTWLESDRFDIAATVGHEIKPTPAGPPAELIQMVKNLLADRFKLVAHTEARDVPIYNLMFARPDARLGAKIQGAEVDCAALMARGGPPPAVPAGQMPPCGTRVGPGRMNIRGGTMAQLARTLAAQVERQVVEKTGLAGAYDLDLEWTQDQTADTTGPSIFTALQEQLGLKLESARGPVDILVIDGAQAPTPD